MFNSHNLGVYSYSIIYLDQFLCFFLLVLSDKKCLDQTDITDEPCRTVMPPPRALKPTDMVSSAMVYVYWSLGRQNVKVSCTGFCTVHGTTYHT